MEWIEVEDENEITWTTDVIVKDCNGWIGQALKMNGRWQLETFGETDIDIYFGRIVAYCLIPLD